MENWEVETKLFYVIYELAKDRPQKFIAIARNSCSEIHFFAITKCSTLLFFHGRRIREGTTFCSILSNSTVQQRLFSAKSLQRVVEPKKLSK